MKKIIILTIVLGLTISCKSPEEKLTTDIKKSITAYNSNLSKQIGSEVKNFIINKIDTLNSSKEKEILLNYLNEEYLILGDKKNFTYNELQIKRNSLKSSEQLNQSYPGYQNIVDRDRIEYNKYNDEFNSLQYDEIILNKTIQKLNREVKLESKNKTILAYRVLTEYDVKLKDGSIHHVSKYFILNKDKDVYDEENYISNLRKKYTKTDL